jgi:thioredoxin-related protein
MKNRFSILVILLFSLVLQSRAGETKERVIIKNAARKAAKEHKLLAIEFWSPSCNSCIAMKRDIFENKVHAETVHKYFLLMQVSPADSIYKSLWKYYKLEYESSVIYVDKNGNEFDRTVGYNGDRDAYLTMVNDLARGRNLYKEVAGKFRKDSLNVSNCFLMARKLAFRYELEESARLYNKVLSQDPANKHAFRAECLFKIAEAEYTRTGNLKKMREFADTVSKNTFAPKAYLYLINDLINKKDRTACLAICEAGLRKYLDSWEILNKYAWALCTFKIQERYPEALSMVQKSIALNPGRPGTYSTEAWIYFEMGNREKAVELQKRAIEIFPDRSFVQDLEIFEKK